jgi:hypothetical protein
VKDKHDKQTKDAFRASSARERQAAYKARQRAAGRTQVLYWLTPEERAFVDTVLGLGRDR